METKQIAEAIDRLDQKVSTLGNSIISARNQIGNLYNQASQYEMMAYRIQASASGEEDSNRIAQLYSQANAYIQQAASARAHAEYLEDSVVAMCSELREYKDYYQTCINEAVTNINNLKATVQILLQTAQSSYGNAQSKTALQKAKQRLTDNNNLATACRKRITWIDNIAGSSGGQYQKVLRR